MPSPKRGEKTRNMGTWTEAFYWSTVRSLLRNGFKYYKPISECRRRARVGKGKYKCENCGKIVPAYVWDTYKSGKKKGQKYKRSFVQVDHIVPVGQLRCSLDLPEFLERLTCEDPNGYRLICLDCHKLKTADDIKNMRAP